MIKNSLVVITAAKNEGRYIQEWIRFHIALGIKHIIIFDNDSEDDTFDKVMAMSNLADIRLYKWPTQEGLSPQLGAFNDGISRAREEFEWGAFIDVDEFLVPPEPLDFEEWLSSAPEDVGAIAVCQRVFGSAGHLQYEDAPVITRFTKSSLADYDENRWFKTIYRLKCVEHITGSHTSAITGRYVYPNFETLHRDEQFSGKSQIIEGSVVQLHHYILKSLEEFQWKRSRGGGAAHTLAQRMERYKDDSFFTGRDAHINAVDNFAALDALTRSGFDPQDVSIMKAE